MNDVIFLLKESYCSPWEDEVEYIEGFVRTETEAQDWVCKNESKYVRRRYEEINKLTTGE